MARTIITTTAPAAARRSCRGPVARWVGAAATVFIARAYLGALIRSSVRLPTAAVGDRTNDRGGSGGGGDVDADDLDAAGALLQRAGRVRRAGGADVEVAA